MTVYLYQYTMMLTRVLFFIADQEMQIEGDHLWREKPSENERHREED